VQQVVAARGFLSIMWKIHKPSIFKVHFDPIIMCNFCKYVQYFDMINSLFFFIKQVQFDYQNLKLYRRNVERQLLLRQGGGAPARGEGGSGATAGVGRPQRWCGRLAAVATWREKLEKKS